jgi:hypothetical protein
MSCLGYALLFALRVNMSVAIVCMLNQTAGGATIDMLNQTAGGATIDANRTGGATIDTNRTSLHNTGGIAHQAMLVHVNSTVNGTDAYDMLTIDHEQNIDSQCQQYHQSDHSSMRQVLFFV